VKTLLVDRLVCPRCGPPFGLVLLADAVEERRVLQGVLGCPNCRDRFPIAEGIADLRPPPRTDRQPSDLHRSNTGVEPLHLAAGLGITEGPGVLVMMGSTRGSAPRLAEMMPQIDVVVAGNPIAMPSSALCVIQVRGRLPFHDVSLRGVVMDRDDLSVWGAEAARVLKAQHRLVLVIGRDDEDDSTDTLKASLNGAGFDLALADGGLAIAVPRKGR
jgi:uncharacterized protein YbaR (Trm112 family)